MKKLLLLVAFAIVGMTSTQAQHEVKLNLLGATFSNYALSYEYVLNEKAGINITGSYFSAPKFLDGIFDSFNSASISGEYRIYFKAEDNAASGFWIAPYVKYNRKSFDNIPAGIDSSLNIGLVDITSNKLALGLSLGSKKVADSGLIYGWYVGIGRNLVNSRKFEGTELSEAQKDALSFGLTGMQYRLGVNVGYRFGSASSGGGSSSKRKRRK